MGATQPIVLDCSVCVGMVLTFPIASASCRVVVSVCCEVCRPLMTSTSFMTGTGFMKCMPIT